MKARRQTVILELIDREPLHNQEQLRRRLRQRGLGATQATISRDIAELGLVEAGGRRRVSAVHGRRHHTGHRPDGPPARRGRVPAAGRARPAARGPEDRHRAGAAAGLGDRPDASAGGRRHDCGRRHHSHHRSRCPSRRRAGEALRAICRQVASACSKGRIRFMTTLWSGRFDTAPDAAAFEFGASFRFDRRLFEDDVTGSLAWARALAQGRRPVGRGGRRRSSRRSARCSSRAGRLRRSSTGPDEDVHSFVERLLVERLGDAGRRLHTGRSRNEQVSLDLRLYLRRRIPVLQHGTRRA